MSIAENIKRIRENIASVSGGRQVFLVAATKMNSAEAVREAVAAGVDACGENRVQEFLEKDALNAYAGAPRHLIGHLQRNKVNKIVGRVELIQSVDSAELIALIDRRARSLGIVQDILLEISIAGEIQKSGAPLAELPKILDEAAQSPGICVRGLMCIPPISTGEGANRPYFAAMRKLFVDIQNKKCDNITLDYLSMGMTDDYMDAILEGANMIRVGTGIFGARTYPALEA